MLQFWPSTHSRYISMRRPCKLMGGSVQCRLIVSSFRLKPSIRPIIASPHNEVRNERRNQSARASLEELLELMHEDLYDGYRDEIIKEVNEGLSRGMQP